MLFVGIDPGASSGLAVIVSSKKVTTVACRDHLDDAFLLLRSLKPDECVIGLEQVHAVYGASAKATFSFGANYGFWVGVLRFLNLPFVSVSPKEWQEAMTEKPARPNIKLIPTKDRRKVKTAHKEALKMESFRAATVAFPAVALPSHDVADAVNIARYIRWKHENQREIL